MLKRQRPVPINNAAELSTAIKSNGGEVPGVFYVRSVERDEDMVIRSEEEEPVDGHYRQFADAQIPDKDFVFQSAEPKVYPSTLLFNEETILEGVVEVLLKG